MNILFFIGNGFDLNLNMATSYRDFYKYYASVKSSSPLIQKLKKEIGGNIENWSDLELALGKYTVNLKSTHEFNEAFNDIEDQLADYLESIENGFDFSKVDGKKLYRYIVSPENSLPTADKNRIDAFRNSWRNTQWNIYLLTYNYTRSLEKLLNYSGKAIQINDFLNQPTPSLILHKIEHVHGYYNDRMVMGVNDISQVSNSDFHSNNDILETLIKNDCNQAQKHTIDDWCKSLLPIANLICIFGSSIGDTDKLWWELIGEQLKRDCRLIIFEKGEYIPPRRPQKGKIAERLKKKYFLDKTLLNDQEKAAVESNIFVGINTNMFDII